MKKYELLAVLLFPLLSFAQFKLAVTAGANDAGLHYATRSPLSSVSKGIGTQAGIYTQYRRHQWFYYTGVNVAQYNFSRKEGDNAYYRYTYRPLYLQMPAGVGYYLPLHKGTNLKLYGGVQGMLGIGGKVKEPHFYICITDPCPQPTDRLTNDIKFGNSKDATSYESFAKAAASAQAGAAVNLSDKIEAGISYAWGLTDARGVKDNYTGKAHLNSWDVSVKYYFLSK